MANKFDWRVEYDKYDGKNALLREFIERVEAQAIEEAIKRAAKIAEDYQFIFTGGASYNTAKTCDTISKAILSELVHTKKER